MHRRDRKYSQNVKKVKKNYGRKENIWRRTVGRELNHRSCVLTEQVKAYELEIIKL